MSITSLSSFISRSFRPTIIGFNLAFLSFLILLGPELLFVNKGYPVIKIEYSFIVITLFIIAAFFYSLFFNTFFFISRIISALFSHINRIWPPVVPGIALFILFGHGAYNQIKKYSYVNEFLPLPIVALLFFISLGVFLLILYRIPVIRGINGTFLFTSVLIARVLFYPLESFYQSGSFINFMGYEICMLLCVFISYITLQIRFRQHLSPDYESFGVPIRMRIISVSLLTIFLILYLAIKLDSGETRYFDFHLAVPLLIVSGFSSICLVQWFLTGQILNKIHNFTGNRGISKQYIAFLIFLFIITTTLFSSIFIIRSFPDKQASGVIVRKSVISQNVLYASGSFLDFDNDGNSKWPGGDPDDRNACIRLDYQSNCNSGKSPRAITRNVTFNSKNDKPLKFINAPHGSARTLILLSIVGAPEEFRDLNSLFPIEEKKVPYNFRKAKIFLSSNKISHSLRALFQNLNGIQEYNNIRRDSIFTEYSKSGYRTICGGYDGNNGYLNIHAKTNLDKGCQIFLPSMKKKEHSSLNDTIQYMNKKYNDYREKYTFLWIHYHHKHNGIMESGPGNATIQKENTKIVIQQLIKKGRLVVILFNEKKLTADVWISVKKPVSPHLDFTSLREIMNFVSGKRILNTQYKVKKIGIIANEHLSWMRKTLSIIKKKPSYLIYTGKKGKISLFEGITGAGWNFE